MAHEFQHLVERGLTQESVYRGKLLKIRVDTVALPDGEIANREIVEHPGAVAVVPLTDDGQVVLVRQFRYPINRITLEIPAGKLEFGEEPEATCRRELAEETGLAAASLEKLTEIVVAPGYSSERLTLYKATGLTPTDAKPDGDEFIETVKLPLAEVHAMIKRGEIQDAKTIVALSWLR
ncbi:ADP-ribose pyrophosphatase [compost metagenome]